MPTNKVKFKLVIIAQDVTKLHASNQKAVNEMKVNKFEEMKTLDIELGFQQLSAPKSSELVGERILRGFKLNEYEADGTQIVKWYTGKISAIRKKQQSLG